MRCEDARGLVGTLLDGEASASEALRAHVDACPECGRALADARQTSVALRSAGRMRIPETLENRVRAALAAEAAVTVRPVAHLRALLPQAAALVAACALSAFLTFLVMRPAYDLPIERDVLSAHIRSLLQDSPIQIASGDPHSVRPWFAGRVEFAPAAKDLAAEGFPLKGARLDFVGGRRVAALVYGRRLHVVNVFVWPAATSGDAEPRGGTIDGYNLVAWQRGGLAYWAVSDLNAGELRLLAGLL